MKKYIGTKEVSAMPMTLGEFIGITKRDPYANDPNKHNSDESGYFVKYKDGYESWSPKGVFEEAYREITDEKSNMGFGDAIEILKQGGAIRRKGWTAEYLPPVIEDYPKYTPLERVEYNKEVNLTYMLLNEGSVAVTDGASYEKVSKHTWMKDSKGYASTTIEGRPVRLQNFLFDEIPEGLIVDHINGDKLDNRMCNLRFATNRENIANSSSKKGSTSSYKGVSFDSSRGKWISSIQINGKTKHLGRYDKEEDAAKAYDRAAFSAYGSYARLNFPQYVLPKKFVIKQVPAHIDSEVIPKMQSLPQSAKDLILTGKGFINYTNQCIIYNENTGRADSWIPSISDVFAEDWEIVK